MVIGGKPVTDLKNKVADIDRLEVEDLEVESVGGDTRAIGDKRGRLDTTGRGDTRGGGNTR